MDVKELYVLLTANTARFTTSMSAADAKAKESENVLMKAGKAAGVMGAAVVTAGAVGTVAMVDMAKNFQTLTNQLVTGAGESAKNIDMIRKGLLEMGSETGNTPDELAKGLYNIESAGFHGAAGLMVLKTADEAAKVGGADMATVTDAVTSALNAYGLKGTDAAHVTNDLIATVASGKMHLQDLAGALGTILPEAAGLHIGLNEITGAMATMTMQGTNADTAATYLRFTLSSLANPTGKARDEMDKLGISAKQVGDTLVHHGLQAALEEVTDAAAKKFPRGSAAYVAAVAEMVGGTRGLNSVLELTGTHSGQFTTNVQNITKAVKDGGNSVAGWAATQQTFDVKLAEAKGAAESLAISWGTKLLPLAGQLADKFVTDVVPALEKLGDWVQDTGIPAAEQFGNNVNQDLIQPLIEVGKVVLPPLLSALGWLKDHLTLVEAVAGAWLARWVAIKGLGIASEVLQWAGAMRTFAAAEGAVNAEGMLVGGGGKLNALLSTLGMGGNGGLSGALRGVSGDMKAFGAAAGEGEAALAGAEGAAAGTAEAMGGAEAAAGTLGLGMGALATGGVLLLGAGLVGLATDAGGVRTALKNAIAGEDIGSAMKRNEQGVDDLRTSITGVATESQKTAVVQGILQARFQSLSDSHAGMDQLKGSAGDLVTEMTNLQNGTDDASSALARLAASGDSEAKKLLASQTKMWNQMADTARHTNNLMLDQNVSTYDMMKSNLQDLATQHGLTGKKAVDWVNAQMDAWRKLNPDMAKANDLITQQANYLGMDIKQAKLFGEDTVSAMYNAKVAIDNTNRSAQTLAANLAKGIDATSRDAGVITHRATGGPIHGEGDVLVGERGPEILHLGTMVGSVTPNVNLPALGGQQQGGGGGTVIQIQNVQVSGVQNIQDLANKIREAALYQARGQGVRTIFGSYA